MSSRDDAISATALADLAKAGYSISRRSFMQVSFEVHHLVDRSGYLRDELRGRLGWPYTPSGQNASAQSGSPSPAQGTALPFETVSSSAYGVGLVVATHAGSLRPEMHDRRQGSGLPVALRVDDRGGARVFQGTARPNPNFIYESARAFEGLVCLDEHARMPSYRHGLAIRELLHFIAELANKNDAPLLLLHSPVQLPAERSAAKDVRYRKEDWPRSSSVAVRFSIALKRPSAQLRLRLTRDMSTYCEDRGFGLWLADIRPGYRPGNWFPIEKLQPTTARQHLTSEFPGVPDACPTHSFPVTIVGPARVGSTHAVLAFLREHPTLGVLACTVSSLDDLAFIHLQLVINDAPSALPDLEQRLDDAIRRSANAADGENVRTSPPDELLPAVLPLLTRDGEPDIPGEVKGLLVERVGNYQALAGPPMRLLGRPDPDTGVALWFSWQTTGGDQGLAAPLIALIDALDAERSEASGGGSPAKPTIEYLICRDLGDSLLRGKGKIYIPMRGLATNGTASLETAGARMSTSLQDAWRAELERYPLPGVVELGVAWHEYRLDHSTAWL